MASYDWKSIKIQSCTSTAWLQLCKRVTTALRFRATALCQSVRFTIGFLRLADWLPLCRELP